MLGKKNNNVVSKMCICVQDVFISCIGICCYTSARFLSGIGDGSLPGCKINIYVVQ